MNGKNSTIGFVGLGTMGSAIAARLLEEGYRVVGYNRTRSRAEALTPLGLEVVDSPRAAAAATDVCFSMVSDDRALDAVAHGEQGILAGLRKGAVYVELSTVSPEAARALAGEVQARGAIFLDAPVSGSVGHAQSGRLSLMIGGPQDAIDRVKPVLQTIGEKITRVGDPGQGKLMKLATNLQVFVQTLGFAESLRLAEHGGIDPPVAMKMLLGSVIASPMLQYRAPLMLDRAQEAWFTIDLSLKDLQLAIRTADELGASLPLTRQTAEAFEHAVRTGHGPEELAAIYDVVDQLQPARSMP